VLRVSGCLSLESYSSTHAYPVDTPRCSNALFCDEILCTARQQDAQPISFALAPYRLTPTDEATTAFLVIALMTSGRSISVPEPVFAEDAVTVVPEDAGPIDMPRVQWRERILEDKRRARQLAIGQRGRMPYQPPPPSREEEDREASGRVLNDDSLQPGDIVSTNKGPFVFKGRPDRERGNGDFVTLPPR
jgi:hypothetical protein